jgi:hypothetical protein
MIDERLDNIDPNINLNWNEVVWFNFLEA